MIILPAIDMIDGKVVRLFRGDYKCKTEYALNAVDVSLGFKNDGAKYIHLVDLDGAKCGEPRNFDLVKEIIFRSKLKAEIGGGIRSAETVEKYLSIGAERVILGTVALGDKQLLKDMVKEFGEKISIGVDIKNKFVAIKGWTEISQVTIDELMGELEALGVKNVICTDISKDGAMQGTNHELYADLVSKFKIDITASGGVSSMKDIVKLKQTGVYGAIIGKALYTNEINLKSALEEARR